MLSPSDFKPYQVDAIKLQSSLPATALILDPGLGKTVITLTTIADLFDRCLLYGVAVLAPKRVCETVWEQESWAWSHLPELRFAHVYGAAKKRERAMQEKVDIYLINYENWMWFVRYIAENFVNAGKPCPFNGIVFDEFSKMANKSAERSKYLRALLKGTEIVWRTGLGATPAANGLMKLQGEYLALDDGERLGATKHNFQQRYFYYNYYSETWEPQHRAKERIFEQVKDISMAATQADHLDLPPVETVDLMVDLKPARRVEYEELKQDFYTQLGKAEEGIEVYSVAAMMGKCLQYANGAVYRRDSKEYIEVHDQKLDALETLVDSLDGLPLLLCYSFRPLDSERIRGRLNGLVKDVHDFEDSREMLDRWNSGDIPVLMGHPGSMGHGLNLQQHHHICWFGLNWDLELYIQSNGRLDRQGQKNVVMQYRILCRDSFDLVVRDALKTKNTTQSNFIKLIKEHEHDAGNST